MDSRIREIEQWVAEAKSDLGECGREAYLRKLFLLDAEIKAVLKENHGILPEAHSPGIREKRVRRFSTPPMALAGVAGALLLTASTVYLTPILLASRNSVAQDVPAAAPAMLLSSALHAPGYIPQLPAGESLVSDGWQPTLELAADDTALLLADTQLQPGTLPGPTLLASGPSLPAAASPAGAAPLPVGRPAASGGNQATSVIVLASVPAGGARIAPVSNTGRGSSSLSFGGDGAIISRETSYPSEDEFRSDFAINQTKEKTSKAAQTAPDGKLPPEITPEEAVDNVDNQKSTEEDSVDKLDPDELKATLEKPFNR